MMKQIFILIILSLLFSACSNVSMQLPDEAEWVYYNQNMIDNRWTGHLCEYQIQIADSVIYAKSMCSKHCDIINDKGILIDTATYDSVSFRINMEYSKNKKSYVWDDWEYNVSYTDKSRIESLKYISKPTESLKLISRRRPKREHRIEYTLDDKEYSVILPSERGRNIIYNICQYNETKFLF